MATQKYVLIGPHADKTIDVNGHKFEDGEMTFHGAPDVIVGLTQLLSFYGAVPSDTAELLELRRLQHEKLNPQDPAAVPATPVLTPEPVVAPDATTTPAEDEEAAKAAAEAKALAEALGDDSQAGEVDLSEALSTLDPEVEAHWTSNNLPSLEYLSTMTGKKISRSEVDEVAEGYTRAKARAAK